MGRWVGGGDDDEQGGACLYLPKARGDDRPVISDNQISRSLPRQVARAEQPDEENGRPDKDERQEAEDEKYALCRVPSAWNELCSDPCDVH